MISHPVHQHKTQIAHHQNILFSDTLPNNPLFHLMKAKQLDRKKTQKESIHRKLSCQHISKVCSKTYIFFLLIWLNAEKNERERKNY